MRHVPRLFLKSVKEQLREPLVLGGTVLMGAAFMVIFGLALGEGYYTYKVAVQDHDRSGASAELLAAIEAATYPDGGKLFEPHRVDGMSGLEKQLQDRDLVAFLEIPHGYAQAVEALGGRKESGRFDLPVLGDPANPSFNLVLAMLGDTLDQSLSSHGYEPPRLSLSARYLEAKSETTGEFTYMAPGLMLMSIMLLIIQFAMAIVKEVQSGTILRLRLSGVPTSQFLAGVSLSQV
ncbi:MAG: ABC transporter permease, partial [Myxococcota bacterium]|nr:ABC transporter permease [Myxococcota bacterium]